MTGSQKMTTFAVVRFSPVDPARNVATSTLTRPSSKHCIARSTKNIAVVVMEVVVKVGLEVVVVVGKSGWGGEEWWKRRRQKRRRRRRLR